MANESTHKAAIIMKIAYVSVRLFLVHHRGLGTYGLPLIKSQLLYQLS